MISSLRFGVFTIEFDRKLLTQKLSLIGEEVYSILTVASSFLQPGSTMMPAEAARRIHMFYWGGSDADAERRLAVGRGYITLVTELWILILDVVQQLPRNYDGSLAQEKLVDMIAALAELEYVDVNGDERRGWDGLPMFKITVCDEMPSKFFSSEMRLCTGGIINSQPPFPQASTIITNKL